VTRFASQCLGAELGHKSAFRALLGESEGFPLLPGCARAAGGVTLLGLAVLGLFSWF